MKKIEIFDAKLCCSTGVCGPNPDPVLSHFAKFVSKARRRFWRVKRFHPLKDQRVFEEHPVVKFVMEKKGEEALPLIIINNHLTLQGRYPRADEAAKWIRTPRTSGRSVARKT